MGIETANGGETWKKIKAQLRRVGYEIEPKEQNARVLESFKTGDE